ncbi:MAG: hypothetical protein NVSMB56_18620 [Pyrinomonadaceae bacterium]
MNKATQNPAIAEARHINADFDIKDLDNAAWSQATPVSISRYWSGATAPSSRHAEARVVWSNENLYVRFVANQNEPLIISDKPQTQKKTNNLWERDVCEIFVAPDANDPTRYREFEVAPTGEWVDLAIHQMPYKRESDFDFNSGMITAARIEKNKITIALRVPFKQALNNRPQANETWRANLMRCVGHDDKSEPRGYLAWQPTETAEPNFHVPQKFGWLKFIA